MYVSATPNEWELEKSKDSGGMTELIVRPTGLLDPIVTIKPSKNQIKDILKQVEIEVEKRKRVILVTLTKRMSEDLTDYLKDKGINVCYMHGDIDTLDRSQILTDLRKGSYDVIVGVNLLREGIDLPEVSLVAILDADKEGFLRNYTSLVQSMGRAARNEGGRVILYADKITKSIKASIAETTRRRNIQIAYNKKHNITPTTIVKGIRDVLIEKKEEKESIDVVKDLDRKKSIEDNLLDIEPFEFKTLIKTRQKYVLQELKNQMKKHSGNLDFEQALKYRDKIKSLR